MEKMEKMGKKNGYKGRKMIGGKLRRLMAHMYGNFNTTQK
jgi:hypothetical protein